MRHFTLLFVVLTVVPILRAEQGSEALPNRLTDSEARQLATLSLPKGTVSLPKFSLEPSPVSGVCMIFDALWENPRGSAHIDFWLVNLRTGEVWRGVDPVCRRVESRALASAQKELRKKLGISDAEVRQERHRVCCADVVR